MSMGGNIAVPTGSLRATLRWTAGPGVPDVDASALLLDDTGEVGSDSDFVFYNQPTHYTGSVSLAGKTPGPQASASIDVHLSQVPADCHRIVLAASADGGTFGQVPDLQLLLADLATGQLVASFAMAASNETACVTAEIYRRNGAWKFRAVGQGYASGFTGLAGDFGIDVGEAEPATPVAAAPVAAADDSLAPDQPVAVGLDLSDNGGVGLLLPVTDDIPPEFSGQVAAPPVAAPPAADPPAADPPAAVPAVAASSTATALAAPASVPPMPPPSTPPTTGAVQLHRNDRVELTHSTPGPLSRVVFSLGWTPADGHSDVDLDASVIAFDASAEKLAIVWYMHTNEFYGALQHSGDNRKGGTGDAEQVLVDLVRLPANVAALVFTINSFRKTSFTDIANAYCAVRDVDTGEELVRFDLSDTQPSTAVLMAELRRGDHPGMWRVRAIGEFHDYRTVKKLVPSAARQVRIGG
jgi:stress response protein SCP2